LKLNYFRITAGRAMTA